MRIKVLKIMSMLFTRVSARTELKTNNEISAMSLPYLIGQRVLLNNLEIGTIVKPERKESPNTDTYIWVFAPSRGYASQYSVQNIKPLPNGQL